ncbi:MAG TPA: PAS domain S-box protein, partial [Pseudomonadales bacterium]|nr:PAS domain S-box protein [Pseudomonadales bacterium]
MNASRKKDSEPVWAAPHIALLIIACAFGLVEWQVTLGNLDFGHLPPVLLVLLVFAATFSNSTTWIIQFTLCLSAITIAISMVSDLNQYEFFALGPLIVIWFMVVISLGLRRQRLSPDSQLRLMENMGLSSLILAEDFTILWCNDAWHKLTDSEQTRGRKQDFLTYLEPREREAIQMTIQRLDSAETIQLESLIHFNGMNIPVQLSVSRSDGPDGYEVLCQDLSNMKETEAALHAAEQLIDQQLQDTPLVHMQWTVDGHIKGWNKAAEKALGFTKDEAMRNHLLDLVVPDLHNDATTRLKATLNMTGETTGISKLFHKDGSIRYLRYHNNIVKDSFGKVTGIHGFSEDITEGLELRCAIRDSEAKFSSVFHNCSDGLALILINGKRIINSNPAFINMLGYQQNKPDNPEYLDSWKPLRDYHKFISLLNHREEVSEFETEFPVLDGTTLPVLLSTNLLEVNNQSCMLVVIKDTSAAKKMEKERRSLEAQLVQVQKIESVGQLAGGIALGFNNMISNIQGFAELIRDQTEEADRRYGYSKQIISSANRVSDLTEKLLAFSRSSALETKPVDLSECMANTLSIFVKTIDPRITVNFSRSNKKYMVMGDKSQLENAILSLCLNARDAMLDGGVLNIEIDHIRFDETACQQIEPDLQAGDYIRLSFRDTGHGIPKHLHENILMPFFTSREVGKGTGLGLSSVYGTVKSHKGGLTVKSEVNNG